MNEEKQKILNVLNQYEQSTNTGDAKLAAGLYTSDAILIPEAFSSSTGRQTIFNFYEHAFSALELALKFEIDEDQIIVEGEIAFATTFSTGTRYIKATEETIPENNRELWIFRKIDEDWRILRYMFNKLV